MPKKENIRLPVAVRGSKTSVLKFPRPIDLYRDEGLFGSVVTILYYLSGCS